MVGGASELVTLTHTVYMYLSGSVQPGHKKKVLCTVDFKDFLLQNWNLIFFLNLNGTYVEDWIMKVTVSY